MERPRVLFLCTGNSARSQMAEVFLRAYAGAYFEVHSAGIEPKGYIPPEVLAVMKERGIDMAGQTSKEVTVYLGKMIFAYTITVCEEAEENCPAVFLSMGKHKHWPLHDPAKFQGSETENIEYPIGARPTGLWEQEIQPAPL